MHYLVVDRERGKDFKAVGPQEGVALLKYEDECNVNIKEGDDVEVFTIAEDSEGRPVSSTLEEL